MSTSPRPRSSSFFADARHDVPASVVVFLVALPLCLGIALASGAPLVAGLVAGIVGGLVVGTLSGSALSVSGPAAGLTVIVLDSIRTLGSYEAFLVAGVLAGALQIGIGFLRAGTLGDFFPSAVIRGMLAGIGIILILKQLPHAVGWDSDYIGDVSFAQDDGETTFSAIAHLIEHVSWGAALIAVVGLTLLFAWERPAIKRSRLRLVPGPLLAVLSGVALDQLFLRLVPALAVGSTHRVTVPTFASFEGLKEQLHFPDFQHILGAEVWMVAITLAMIASLETLLSVDAADRLDPRRRLTPKNRELKAQGVGNIVSSLLGGLPLTAVIVRSSANVVAGGRTKQSSVLHGLWLLLSVLLLAEVLALIPLTSLAAILLFVGFKLTPPALYVRMYKDGWSQLIPFGVTIVAMVLTNLLVGVLVGLVVGTFYVFQTNFKTAVYTLSDGDRVTIRFLKDVSFLNKAKVRQILEAIGPGAEVVIDTSESVFVDHDIQQTLDDFCALAPERNIKVELRGAIWAASRQQKPQAA